MTQVVRAAGGVVWRPVETGVEICVVHRPYLSDWSLPKGKLDGSEHTLTAAVREVFEETGVRAEPQLRLPGLSYTMPNGVAKTVDFWLMKALPGPAGEPQDPAEVDKVLWLSPADAVDRLSYPDDKNLVEHVMTLPPVTGVTLLVRHARAGKRKNFKGDDALRPVDKRGRAQAATIATVALNFAPQALVAAAPLRCVQTFEPLAQRLDLPIVADSAFAEPADGGEEPPDRLEAAVARLLELRSGPRAAICSQGKVIPGLLAALEGAGDPEPYKTAKGDGWVLSWSGDTLIALSRI